MLEGTCNKLIKQEKYNRYEISEFRWDLRTSNVHLVVKYYQDQKNSFINQIYTFQEMEDVDVNKLIDQVNNIIHDANN